MFQKVDSNTLCEKMFTRFASEWFLLTAGDPEHCNTMTAAWGGIGVLWGKNVATVYVRSDRYTKEFMDENDFFTMSFLGDGYRDELNLCGTESGRTMDKIKEAGLTKVELDGTTAFEEAEFVLVCKKLCRQELTPEFFCDPAIDAIYAGSDKYHIMYIGEIIGLYRK